MVHYLLDNVRNSFMIVTMFNLFFRLRVGIVGMVCLLVMSSGAVAATKSQRLTAKSGNTEAVLTFEQGEFRFSVEKMRLKIMRSGKVAFDQALENPSAPIASRGRTGESASSPIVIQDLDGDREPEVLIDFFTGGAHCCTETQVYRFNASSKSYVVSNLSTRDIGYELKALDQDGIPEFVSADARFAYRFASFAGSGFPLQVWNYRQGKFVDVTRKFPKLIRDDAYRYWKLVQDRVKSGEDRETKGSLAAYLANKYSLGEKTDGWKNVRSLYTKGDREAYFKDLEKFLKEAGYDR
jgi:hypothetical protein